MSDIVPPALPPVDPSAVAAMTATTLTPELLASLLADGDDELGAWVISHALTEGPRAEVYDGLVFEAMRLVGERWATGQWTVAEEHLASQTLLRALDRVRPELGPEGRVGSLAVLAGVSGEHHMIGLVCLDHVLREGGWTVANLGADVPASDLGTFVGRNDARLVALSASHPARLESLTSSVEAVRARDSKGRRLPIMIGGRLGSHPGVADALQLDWSGDSLVKALEFAHAVRAAMPETDAR